MARRADDTFVSWAVSGIDFILVGFESVEISLLDHISNPEAGVAGQTGSKA